MTCPFFYKLERTGPVCWADCFEDCAGNSQSPIDFNNNDIEDCTVDDEDLEYINYDTPSTITLKNNGHSGRWLICCL